MTNAIAITHLVLEVAGAVSVFCGVLAGILPGKAGAVLGEIGVDIGGFLKELGK